MEAQGLLVRQVLQGPMVSQEPWDSRDLRVPRGPMVGLVLRARLVLLDKLEHLETKDQLEVQEHRDLMDKLVPMVSQERMVSPVHRGPLDSQVNQGPWVLLVLMDRMVTQDQLVPQAL